MGIAETGCGTITVQKVGFGGGCHWCTEAVFQAISAVDTVRQGFIRSTAPPHDQYSEAVEVTFDPEFISLRDLIEVHLATHASTSDHSMRLKYRSAIYTLSADQTGDAQASLEAISDETGQRFVTLVLPHGGFRASEPVFQNYHRTDPDRPFCKTYINPKLAKLRQRFSELL